MSLVHVCSIYCGQFGRKREYLALKKTFLVKQAGSSWLPLTSLVSDILRENKKTKLARLKTLQLNLS